MLFVSPPNYLELSSAVLKDVVGVGKILVGHCDLCNGQTVKQRTKTYSQTNVEGIKRKPLIDFCNLIGAISAIWTKKTINNMKACLV